VQYVFMLPTYVNVFLIYAFVNVHDVSWGLRNDKESHNVANTADREEQFKTFRTHFVLW